MLLEILRQMLELAGQPFAVIAFQYSVGKGIRLRFNDAPADAILDESIELNRLFLVLWKGHAVPPVASIAPEDESPLGSSSACPFWLSLSTIGASLPAT